MTDDLVDIVMKIHQFNQDLTSLNIKYAETIEEHLQEIEQLRTQLNTYENIIKEVREYIEKLQTNSEISTYDILDYEKHDLLLLLSGIIVRSDKE